LQAEAADPGRKAQKARLELLDNPELLLRVQAELIRWKKPRPAMRAAKPSTPKPIKPAPRKPKR
jgi:hypothetical protein